MFERYTEKARRVIFFSRYEASQLGSSYIETEHLLLGIMREDRSLLTRFVPSSNCESIRQKIAQATSKAVEPVKTSIDLPLSNECKRVLAYGAEEAERLSHKHIGTEHVFLGLLREKKSFAAEILGELGVRLARVREELARSPHDEPAQTEAVQHIHSGSDPTSSSPFAGISANLTLQAAEGRLSPLVGREREPAGYAHSLSPAQKQRGAGGRTGVGKRAIVEGLAQRISDGGISQSLVEKSIVTLDFSLPSVGMSDLTRLGKLLALSDGNEIFLVDELHMPDGTSAADSSSPKILKPLIQAGRIQCISLATPVGYARSVEQHPWLAEYFQIVRVNPLSESDAIAVLIALKLRYEKFHGVIYADESLPHAVSLSQRFLLGRHLPEKALDLLDDAGTLVKLRLEAAPADLHEARKELKVTVQRMENAVTNHELQKARFYSDEERKQRDHLKELREKYKASPGSDNTVTRAEIEEAVAWRTGLSIETIMRSAESDKNNA